MEVLTLLINKETTFNYKALVILNTLAYIAMIAINYLANYLPINDITTGEVSALYPNLFTPAGFTFAIWGLIYFLLGVFIAYQTIFLIKAGSRELGYVKRISYLFITSSLLNIAWLFAWHYLRIALSLGIMLLFLINLIILYYRLNTRVNGEDPGYTLTRIAFSVYLGWITIATIANATAFLVDIGWEGFGLSESLWMILISIVATGIVLIFMLKNRDWLYSSVALWAFFGIIYKRLITEPIESAVVLVLIICMLAITAGIVKILLYSRQWPRSLQ